MSAPKLSITADINGPSGPHLILTAAWPLDAPAARDRKQRWADDAAELTRPLRELPPLSAAAVCSRLEAAIAETQAGIAAAERSLADASYRAAVALGDGTDPAAVEAEASATAANLERLRARLPALQSRLADARKDRQFEQEQAERTARFELVRNLTEQVEEVVASLLPTDAAAPGGLLDRLATLQAARAAIGR